jgi:hypothetical protein
MVEETEEIEYWNYTVLLWVRNKACDSENMAEFFARKAILSVGTGI